jgi:hypothetical protein
VFFIILLTFVIATLFGGVPRWKARWGIFRIWFPPKEKSSTQTQKGQQRMSDPHDTPFPSAAPFGGWQSRRSLYAEEREKKRDDAVSRAIRQTKVKVKPIQKPKKEEIKKSKKEATTPTLTKKEAKVAKKKEATTTVIIQPKPDRRQKHLCSVCKEPGHNKATCPKTHHGWTPKRRQSAKKNNGYSEWNDFQKDPENHIFWKSGPRKGFLNQKAMAKAYRTQTETRLKKVKE